MLSAVGRTLLTCLHGPCTPMKPAPARGSASSHTLDFRAPLGSLGRVGPLLLAEGSLSCQLHVQCADPPTMLDKGDSGKEGTTLSTTTIFLARDSLTRESLLSCQRGHRRRGASAPPQPHIHRQPGGQRLCSIHTLALLQPQAWLRHEALLHTFFSLASATGVPAPGGAASATPSCGFRHSPGQGRQETRKRAPPLPPLPHFLPIPLFPAPAPDNRAIRA